MKKNENVLVLDVETQKSFKEVGKSKMAGLSKLKASVVCIYDYQSGEYSSYEEKDMLALDKRIQTVGLLVGFNIKKFDMEVLRPYLFTPVEKLPVLDLLDAIERARGHRASLDSVSRATINEGKSGDGAEAITLFREGRMEELTKYCLDDVRLTKTVYEFGRREGKIFFTSSWDFKKYEIPVDWEKETEIYLSAKARSQNDFPNSLF